MKIKLEVSKSNQTSTVNFQDVLDHACLTTGEWVTASPDMQQQLIQNYVDENFDTPYWEVIGWED